MPAECLLFADECLAEKKSCCSMGQIAGNLVAGCTSTLFKRACYHALDLHAAHPSLSEHLAVLLSYALESGTDAHREGPLPYKGKGEKKCKCEMLHFP